MTNKFDRSAATLFAVIFIILQQPTLLLAAEKCQDIGGTGIVANGCGIGGTGNSSKKEDIGGTGHEENNSGVGGTGIVASKGGIGGTGRSQDGGGIGGTGIVGIITGFGSIWVDGLEVKYDNKTPVADNATTANINDLAIGQVVTIEASGSNDELKASKITVVDAVAGQISAIDTNNAKMTVLGQEVAISSKTIMHDQQNQLNAIQFKQGDYVKVSGLRMPNGEIVASRIQQAIAIAEPNLVGPITKINGSRIEIYGQQIETVENNNLKLGQEIIAAGTLSNGILMSRQIALSPSAQLPGKTQQIRLQGYVAGSAASGQIKVGSMEVIVPNQTAASEKTISEINSGELVQLSGHFGSDNRIIADRIEISIDRPERMGHENTGGQNHELSDRIERSQQIESNNLDRIDTNSYVDRPYHSDSPNHTNSTENMSHGNESSGHSKND